MSRRKRKARPNLRTEGYDSKLERDLHRGPLKYAQLKPDPVPYVVERNYHPDFLIKEGRKTILIEAKGRFWEHSEYSKYLWVAKKLPKSCEIVFIFADPDKPMPGAKTRTDGTKRTHGEWAEKNGFRYYTPHSIPQSWRKKC